MFPVANQRYVLARDEVIMLVCVMKASAVSKCLCLDTWIYSNIIRILIKLQQGVGAALMDIYFNCFYLEDMQPWLFLSSWLKVGFSQLNW